MALDVEAIMSQWTQDDVDRLNAKRGAAMPAHVPVKKSKYRNVRMVVGDQHFDSKREANYWMLLKARESLGEISGLERQVVFPLYAAMMTEDGVAHTGGIVQVSEYRADFVYRDEPSYELHIVDAKGHRTKEYQRSKKWLELQQGIVIEEV